MYGLSPDAEQVTQDELIEFVRGLDGKGMVPFSMTQITVAKTRKPGGLWEQFELLGYSGKNGQTYFAKMAMVSGNLGIDYETKVNRERVKEGLEPNFKTIAPPKYEYHTKNLKELLSERGQFYLAYMPLATSADFETTYVGMKDGEIVVLDEELIREFMPPKKESSSRQGLEAEDQVQIRDISFGSIVGFRANKKDFIIKDVDPLRLRIFEQLLTNRK